MASAVPAWGLGTCDQADAIENVAVRNKPFCAPWPPSWPAEEEPSPPDARRPTPDIRRPTSDAHCKIALDINNVCEYYESTPMPIGEGEKT